LPLRILNELDRYDGQAGPCKTNQRTAAHLRHLAFPAKEK
jgi:hypothetical protein